MNAQELNEQYGPGAEEETVTGLDPAAIESETPSAPAGQPAAARTGILVLSADPALLATVERTGGAERTIVPVAEWAALREELDAGRCGIVLLDMDRVGPALDERLTELEQHPAAPVVVAAAMLGDAPELMQALTERRIHRLLIKPASVGNTRLLLDAAATRWLQLHAAGDRPSAGAARAASRGLAGIFAGRRGWLLGIAMSLVFAVVLAVGLMKGPRDKAPAEESIAVAQPIARPGDEHGAASLEAPLIEIAPDPLAEQLERARDAFDRGHLVEPPEDNALDGFAAILAVDPEHAQAKEGMAATIELLFLWAESALLGDVPELAEMTLGHVRRVRPDSPRLAFLDVQLARAQERAEEATRQAAAVPPPPDEAAIRARRRAAAVESIRQALDQGDTAQAETLLAQARDQGVATAVLVELDRRLSETRVEQQNEREAALLALVVERLRSGQLVAPESDNAVFYLASLRAQNAAHPDLGEPWRELTATLADNFQASLAAAEWDEAQSWLSGLKQIDADAGLVTALATELTVARTQAKFLDTVVPATELQLIEARPLVYPDAALRNGVEGWVELEFIVGLDGRPRDIVVADAEPRGAFERAAANAVTRHRYEPFVLDGVIYERRVNLRIRFALQ